MATIEIPEEPIKPNLDNKEESSRAEPNYIIAACIIAAVVSALVLWMAHSPLFEPDTIISKSSLLFANNGILFFSILVIFLISITVVHGIGKTDDIDGLWAPLMAITIMIFIAWHLLDAIQKKNRRNYMAMVFFFLFLSALHFIPGFIGIRKTSEKDTRHYTHAKIFTTIAGISLVILLYAFYQLYQTIPI